MTEIEDTAAAIGMPEWDTDAVMDWRLQQAAKALAAGLGFGGGWSVRLHNLASGLRTVCESASGRVQSALLEAAAYLDGSRDCELTEGVNP